MERTIDKIAKGESFTLSDVRRIANGIAGAVTLGKTGLFNQTKGKRVKTDPSIIKGKKAEHKEEIVNDGILFCSGMIAGEGLVGIVLALLAVFGVDKMLNLSERFGIPQYVSDLGGLLLFALIVLTVLKFTYFKKREKKS